MRSTLRGLPAPRHAVGFEPDLAVPAADGSLLVTDRYFPIGAGEFPAVLIRSPYGRGFPWASMYGLPLAEQGFHVVIQSCRGTGGSEGEFHLWRHETVDGRATVEWLREQSWFTGVLGMVGPSYLSYVQWALALDPPPELRAMVTQVPLHDPHGFYHSGGAFHLEAALIGAVGMLHQAKGFGAFLRGSARLQRHFKRAARTLPLADSYLPALGGRVPFLDGALAHPEADDPYWVGADLGAAADSARVPVALVSGWYDVTLDQTLAQYHRLRRAGVQTSLLLGPWTHNSALQQGWPEVFRETLAWLRAHLCEDGAGLRADPVRAWMGGSEEWCELAEWPEGARDTGGARWFPGPDGSLGASPETGAVSFRYDPADPTPSVGGQLLSPRGGRRDNAELEARPDVLVFTSEPLGSPLTVLGSVAAEVSVSTRGLSADLFVRLCDVDPKGRSTNVCDGLLRLSPDGREPASVTVPMSAVAHCFGLGHRLRLQISGGAHPRYARNTGTGEPEASVVRAVPVEVTVHLPSALVLPVTG
ncbi:Peptidase S15 [Kitasatospora sp. MMS16-BH015]|uniref:CocE/NonD family hydrolase n=1 Tax=Kitasatospora sp. MMS16-BH015 TaxID=2018025 RepID=UPI000CA1F051|nr:CocE/NonD family hydrolase [Kitasatospora sp. MMS16-BH015]AUG80837.1 Peptidase S15 [Kitasatospora sp. MMS16-BH015]